MIFWFSGTGNARHAAKELARCLCDKEVNMADAVRAGAYEYCIAPGEAVGIIVPVYYWGIPAIAHTFLKNLKLNPGKHYAYAVMVCGGSSCDAVGQVRQYLELNYFAELKMPDNCLITNNDIRHKDEIRACLMNADTELGRIYNHVRRRETININKALGLFDGFISRKAYPSYEKARITKRFYASDACVECGKCAEYCPDDAIEMRDGKPVWVKDKCDLCLACVHLCPKEAVQYGKKTVGKGRYAHPSLKKALAEKEK